MLTSRYRSKKISAKDFSSVKEYYEKRAEEKRGTAVSEDGGKKSPKLSRKEQMKSRQDEKKKAAAEARKKKETDRRNRAAECEAEKARVKETVTLFKVLPLEMPVPLPEVSIDTAIFKLI